ncbi:MAG: metalloregulator ArsR/SmtB family transcription factor [Micropepsaceae bacterium]
MPDQNARLLAFFKALANESRLRLLGFLAQREHSVQELAEAIGVSEPTASHHLAILRDLGLVSRRTEGNTHWYSFVATALPSMAAQILSVDGVAKLAGAAGPRGSAEAIVENFLGADGKLTHIPAQRKKRYAVLAWLVRKFDEDCRYTEKEINEGLQKYHWDSATIRREFIGYGMMAREKGVYWRLSDFDWLSPDGKEPVSY